MSNRIDFFQSTLYWYQILQRDQDLLTNLQERSTEAILWLIKYGLLKDEGGDLLITQLGSATAMSGLLPSTTVQLAQMLREYSAEIEQSFEDWIEGLIYAVCASDEFRGERPSRMLPWIRLKFLSLESISFWEGKKLPVNLNSTDVRLAQCAQAMVLYIDGLEERDITKKTKVSSGYIHRLAIDVSWVLNGVHRLTSVPELECHQTLGNEIALLARRVRWGAPVEALDIIRVAERHRVPGVGRLRAMALIKQGIRSLQDILSTDKQVLTGILRSEIRTMALLKAVSSMEGLGPSRFTATHDRVAKKLGISALLEACDNSVGVDYEKAIINMLRKETSWNLTVLDNGRRQNVPDLLIQLGELKVIVECKTCIRSPALIRKEEAWAVIQKAADFDKVMRRVTLGKPAFNETSKKKASASPDITLVEHSAFLEGLLRVLADGLAHEDFLNWLSEPGVADINRLGGKPTYAI